jgi:hypothetical protein
MRELQLHVEGREIIVKVRHTRLTITYRVSSDGRLEENRFWTVDAGDTEFRQRAWKAARAKARELAWIRPLRIVA